MLLSMTLLQMQFEVHGFVAGAPVVKVSHDRRERSFHLHLVLLTFENCSVLGRTSAGCHCLPATQRALRPRGCRHCFLQGRGGRHTRTQRVVFFEIPARHASPRVMRIFHHKDHMEGELLCTYIVQSFQVIGIVPLFTQIVVRLWAWDMLKFRHRIKLFHW